MQDRSVCFQCGEPIELNSDMLFEPPCGCDHCPSVVFHALCLFDWREHRGRMKEYFDRAMQAWQDHQEEEERRREAN